MDLEARVYLAQEARPHGLWGALMALLGVQWGVVWVVRLESWVQAPWVTRESWALALECHHGDPWEAHHLYSQPRLRRSPSGQNTKTPKAKLTTIILAPKSPYGKSRRLETKWLISFMNALDNAQLTSFLCHPSYYVLPVTDSPRLGRKSAQDHGKWSRSRWGWLSSSKHRG